MIQWVDVEGPILESWPPPSHKAIFGDLKLTRISPERFEVVSSQPMLDAERILRDFARRAFRRNINDVDIQPFLARVKSKLEQNYSFEQAMRVGLKAILVSPNFLFLREQGPKLDDFALASRLSYFLWSSMPDEELFQLAASNRLHEPDVLREQVERLLSDPKARAFNTNFTGQWLSLRAIDATMPDGTLYPEYDDILKTSMLKETSMFFDEVLKNDLPLTPLCKFGFFFPQCEAGKTLPHSRYRGNGNAQGNIAQRQSPRWTAYDGQRAESYREWDHDLAHHSWFLDPGTHPRHSAT